MKYRRKAEMIEAVQWFPGQTVEGVIENDTMTSSGRVGPAAWIFTSKGRCEVRPGDYIITDIKGTKHPCRRGTFEDIYEPTEDATVQRK